VLRVVPVGALHFRKSIGDAFSVSAGGSTAVDAQ